MLVDPMTFRRHLGSRLKSAGVRAVSHWRCEACYVWTKQGIGKLTDDGTLTEFDDPKGDILHGS